jgi:hypothetical protein
VYCQNHVSISQSQQQCVRVVLDENAAHYETDINIFNIEIFEPTIEKLKL